jgi:hypothetical protein
MNFSERQVSHVMGTETPTGTTIRLLQNLKARTEALGLVGRIVQTGRTVPPVLVVINPYSDAMSEEIGCAERDGDWWLFWSWGEPICRATDLEYAVRAVRRVVGGRL